MIRLVAEFRKFIAAATGAVAVAVSAGLLSGTAQRWTVGGLAVATAFVVALVPNQPPVPLATAGTAPEGQGFYAPTQPTGGQVPLSGQKGSGPPPH